MLLVLMAVLAFNQMDGTALGILMQGIKRDLGLTDTQLGFLSGFAFALFYSAMGIPIARWADSGNRVRLIGVTTAVWSLAVAACGLAHSFIQLLLIRIVVGSGEAGCMPSAHSLIADHFSREERSKAVARYMLGVPFALMFGYFWAGWLNEAFGWRATFLMIGMPGLFLAVIAYLSLREPRLAFVRARHSADQDNHSTSGSAPGLIQVYSFLWSNSTFRHLLFCHSVWYFFGFGLQQWTPSFFIRSYGLGTAEIGTWFALIYGVVGAIGVYLGGECAARLAAGRERLQMFGSAISFTFFAISNASAYLVTNHYLAFALLALGVLGGNMAQGPILATIQTLVPARMRAISIAAIYLCSNLIGLGLGPLATGFLSDVLRPMFGQESLRYALLGLCPGYVWAAYHLWRAGLTVDNDLLCREARELGSNADLTQEVTDVSVS